MIINKLFYCFVFFALLTTLPQLGYSDPVKYSVTNESWSPYWITTSNKVSGILNDVMQQLDQRMSISLEADNPSTVKRAQTMFKVGGVQIECCVSKDWRNLPAQSKISLWSDTVMTVEEVLIFPVGKSFKFTNFDDLKGRNISTIRGYGYAGSDIFSRTDSIDNTSQILKVALGEAEAGIIDRAELTYALKYNRILKERNIKLEIGPVINRSELKMRIHFSNPELLEPINIAILEMKQDGTVQNIIDRYTNK